MSAMKQELIDATPVIHEILATLDDLEQLYSDLYEATGNPSWLIKRFDVTAAYHHYDAMRFPNACAQR